MPFPKRKPDERKARFLQRCMSNPTMRREFPDQKQRRAVCESQARKATKP